MRILQIHNSYRQRGGEDAVVERERALLRSQGDDVETFQLENDSLKPGIAAALETVWNAASYRALKKVIHRFRPEVAHFHNTLPRISPSGYYAAKGLGVPVVQTLHNFRLACPSGILYRDGQVCEDCLGTSLSSPGITHACYRNSRAATAAVAVMLTVHRAISTYQTVVDRYIALTEFSRGVFVRAGLPPERLCVKPNFVGDVAGPGGGDGGYALYAGRLVPEKGIATMLRAWRQHEAGAPLLIAGDGPMRTEVEQAAAESGGKIRYLGIADSARIGTLMRDASVVIFPSQWYETFGLSIIEAYAAGTPVLASRMGTMTSLVQEGCTGRLFTSGDAADLANTCRDMLSRPETLAKMRVHARAAWQRHFTPEANYSRLREIYHEATNAGSARGVS